MNAVAAAAAAALPNQKMLVGLYGNRLNLAFPGDDGEDPDDRTETFVSP